MPTMEQQDKKRRKEAHEAKQRRDAEDATTRRRRDDDDYASKALDGPLQTIYERAADPPAPAADATDMSSGSVTGSGMDSA